MDDVLVLLVDDEPAADALKVALKTARASRMALESARRHVDTPRDQKASHDRDRTKGVRVHEL